ncbi:hypothetical protein [Oceanobacillus oncorhynchi]|uniref:hypothetical protein n=1 Tax=Oceanobacillus oncorhynchi TaxID=545501 RepID=UPI002116F091|nr:hypothetical protein [Oceanobacillus oncorhynchi]UUI41159.1 hypothetical protein NP440_06215 [Oceanobacillus oncorhynchi]
MGAVKFKTSGKHVPLIPLNGDNEFIFEDLELVFLPGQLDRIALGWNNWQTIEQISEREERREIEIFLALIHLADKEKITRPLAFTPKRI